MSEQLPPGLLPELYPPAWAVERAKQLHRDEGGAVVPMVRAFARYIAEHEEAPVDPVVLEARNLASDLGWYQANSLGQLHSGAFDNTTTQQGLIAAIRRGIELGKVQP